MKIVINACYGGFGLSDKASDLYLHRKKISEKEYLGRGREVFERNDPLLVKIVEELGSDSYNYGSRLIVIEIPDDVEWEIDEYDGFEWVAEKHRTWGCHEQ